MTPEDHTRQAVETATRAATGAAAWGVGCGELKCHTELLHYFAVMHATRSSTDRVTTMIMRAIAEEAGD